MSFSTLAAKVAQTAQKALGDPGRVLGRGGQVADPCDVVLFLPRDEASLGEGVVVRSQPRVELLVADCPWLAHKDLVEVGGRTFEVAAAPRRSEDGTVWLAPVTDKGPVGALA